MAIKSISSEDMWRIFEDVKNWGRWGADDQRGVLNLITDDKRRAAVALAKEGAHVSCALSLPTAPGPDNWMPVQHFMVRGGDAQNPAADHGGSADYIGLSPHGFSMTHLDALCHFFQKGQMYNGFSMNEVRTDGAQKCSIMAGADGIVTRGVLLDIPALRGVDWLEPGDVVTADELTAAEERQNVAVQPGDALLISTGRDARRAAKGTWSPRDLGMAGLHADCVPWLRERDVAVLGNDGVSDVFPSRVDGWVQPIHQAAITAMGIHIIDNAELARLAAACLGRSRYEFLFVIAPLRLEKGTASPINPVAIF